MGTHGADQGSGGDHDSSSSQEVECSSAQKRRRGFQKHGERAWNRRRRLNERGDFNGNAESVCHGDGGDERDNDGDCRGESSAQYDGNLSPQESKHASELAREKIAEVMTLKRVSTKAFLVVKSVTISSVFSSKCVHVKLTMYTTRDWLECERSSRKWRNTRVPCHTPTRHCVMLLPYPRRV